MKSDLEESTLARQLAETVEAITRRTRFRPSIGLILGSGLGGLTKSIQVEAEIDYDELPHLPRATAPGHEGKLVLGTLPAPTPATGGPGGAQRSFDFAQDRGERALRLVPPSGGTRSGHVLSEVEARAKRVEPRVAVLAGRFHYYEGYSMAEVSYPVRLLRALGAETLILTSIVGSMNRAMPPGSLVLLEDHINLMGANPLIGPNDEALGPRFPDMSAPYDPSLRRLALQVASELDLPLREGVYAAVAGPNLETRAEYRMLQRLGADVVGMSMVPEVLTARHGGLRVLAVVVVSDACIPEELKPASVEELLRVAAETEPSLTRLLQAVITRL